MCQHSLEPGASPTRKHKYPVYAGIQVRTICWDGSGVKVQSRICPQNFPTLLPFFSPSPLPEGKPSACMADQRTRKSRQSGGGRGDKGDTSWGRVCKCTLKFLKQRKQQPLAAETLVAQTPIEELVFEMKRNIIFAKLECEGQSEESKRLRFTYSKPRFQLGGREPEKVF